MSHAIAGDPSDWQVDTVTRYLCTSPGPLFPKFNNSLDPEDLATKIRQNDLQGEFLLELDDNSVKQHLGVVSFGLLVTFRRIISYLRQQSPKWQLQYAPSHKPSGQSDPYASAAAGQREQDVTTMELPGGPIMQTFPPQDDTTQRDESSDEARRSNPKRAALVPVTNEPVTTERPPQITLEHEFDYLQYWENLSDDEVLPPLGASENNKNPTGMDESDDDEHSDSDGNDSNDTEDDNENDETDETEDVQDDQDKMQIDHLTDSSEATTSSSEEETDEASAGGSDVEVVMTPAEIKIRQAEHAQADKWKLKKLPKLELQAYELWMKPNDRVIIREHHERLLEQLQFRLFNLERKLIETATLSELDELVSGLEPTIHDIAETCWKIDLFSQEQQPAKPVRPMDQIGVAKKKKRKINKELDEEDLTSDGDDNDSLDDFIVNDEIAEARRATPPRKATGTPSTEPETVPRSTEVDSEEIADVDQPMADDDRDGIVHQHKVDDNDRLPNKTHLPEFWHIGAWQKRNHPKWAKHLKERRQRAHFLGWNIAQNSAHWSRAYGLIQSNQLDKMAWSKLKPALLHVMSAKDTFTTSMPNETLSVSAPICQIAIWYVCWSAFVLVEEVEESKSQLGELLASINNSRRKDFKNFWVALRYIYTNNKSWRGDETIQARHVPKPKSTRADSRTTTSSSERLVNPGPVRLSKPSQPTPSSLLMPSRKTQPEDDTTSEDEDPIIRRRRGKRKADSDMANDDQLLVETTRGKKVKQDEKAASQRKEAAARMEQHNRNAEIVQKPAVGTSGAGEVYVNPGAQDKKDLIPINHEIKGYLKQNQKDGIAFMWREVIEAGEGALLAHTMGLGKTLQCISLLTTIAEAAKVPKHGHLIPQSLRPMKVAVVVPAALVDNWQDEFYKWAPRTRDGKFYLGDLHIIASKTPTGSRLGTLQHWSASDQNQILLISYSMLTRLVGVKDSDEPDQKITQETILAGADIVIADEAQYLKASRSQTSLAMARFKTTRRIALTGSPLSNNLEEYFAIINWACKGFLGPEREFREMYANPIKHGLYNDSTPQDYRRALVKLRALEKTLAPKMHRAGWEDMLDVPKKTEFTIHLPATDLQRQLYDKLVGMIDDQQMTDNPITVMTHFNALKILAFNPECFKVKLKNDQELLQKVQVHPVKAVKVPAKHGGTIETPQTSFQRLQTLSEAATATTISTRSSTPLAEEDPVQIDPLAALDELDHDRRDPFLSLDRIDLFLQHLQGQKNFESSKLSMVLNIIRHSGNEKVLIFSHSLIILDTIENRLKVRCIRCKRIDGSSGSVHKRQEITKSFNEDVNSAKVMLISTKAGGVGLNLYAASRVIICDDSWNPMNERQAIGRAYRLGQKRHVYVYRLMLSGSYEEALQNQAVFKEQLASRVVERKAPTRYALKDFGKFLRPLAVKPQQPLEELYGKDTMVLDHLLGHEKIIHVQVGEEFTRESQDKLTAAEEGEANLIVEAIKQGKRIPMTVDNPSIPLRQSNNFSTSTIALMQAQRLLPPEQVAAMMNRGNTPSYPNVGFRTGPMVMPSPSLPSNTAGGNFTSARIGPSSSFPLLQQSQYHQYRNIHPVPSPVHFQQPRTTQIVDLVDNESTSEGGTMRGTIQSIERGDRIPPQNRHVSVSSGSDGDAGHSRPPGHTRTKRNEASFVSNNQPISARQRAMEVRGTIPSRDMNNGEIS